MSINDNGRYKLYLGQISSGNGTRTDRVKCAPAFTGSTLLVCHENYKHLVKIRDRENLEILTD